MASELRMAFGESLLLPHAKLFPSARLQQCLTQWDTHHAFETPTILRQLRNALLSSTSTTTTSTTDTTTNANTGSDTTVIVIATDTAAATTPSVPIASTDTTTTTQDPEDVIVSSNDHHYHNSSSTNNDTEQVVPHAVDETHVVVNVDAPVPAKTNHDPSTEVVVITEKDQPIKDTNDVAPVGRSRRNKTKKSNHDDDDDEVVIVEKEKDALDLLMEGKSNRSVTILSNSSTALGTTLYDFDAHSDIPPAKVQANEFIEPCRLIATLQIARDLRNDGAVQVSSLLQSLPEPVRRFIAEAAEATMEEDDNVGAAKEEDPNASSKYELSDSAAREFVSIMNEQLLDMNMNEQLENVRTFMELIQRQKKARETIHERLIASRCQFGAPDVAATYSSLTADAEVLKRRAQILADAMDLEGWEVQPVNPALAALTALDAELPPFSWYHPEDPDQHNGRGIVPVPESDHDPSPHKRQKT